MKCSQILLVPIPGCPRPLISEHFMTVCSLAVSELGQARAQPDINRHSTRHIQGQLRVNPQPSTRPMEATLAPRTNPQSPTGHQLLNQPHPCHHGLSLSTSFGWTAFSISHTLMLAFLSFSLSWRTIFHSSWSADYFFLCFPRAQIAGPPPSFQPSGVCLSEGHDPSTVLSSTGVSELVVSRCQLP